MSRLSKRLSRKRTRRVVVPPPEEVMTLREIAGDDPRLRKVSDAVEQILDADAGGYLRVGGPDEPKRAKPLPEWKKPPPETP
jgi:hypothetical protein